ncbi:MAG: DUF4404 family protein [Spirochaetes bacterium]|nr:DUF4404 family protein [Spirochaetota bacterium]
MPVKTIKKTENIIKKSSSLSSIEKTKILGLISTLKKEISVLSRTHKEDAQSIAGFTYLSSHEAVRKSKKPGLFDLSLKGLAESIKEFEQSHPVLVKNINNFINTLSNMGI